MNIPYMDPMGIKQLLLSTRVGPTQRFSTPQKKATPTCVQDTVPGGEGVGIFDARLVIFFDVGPKG